ncbi:hypothetical protein OPV22_035208 [Ensete ventricosum]|uniref:Uncharacterized protein n=1 Tax=Ensete ventricosum TaxID=4639 RepID=A0AAX5NB89_ENSVE|nr:hypothetical protein OPV22_035234 [Ensete ventricosum]KAJ8453531.1 hypothetical protein OPV22_035232 [Ensete ventricosum]KAJ8454704.1 hypothetical protein OPV22_035208 [Ensete ventricosum]
MGSYGGRFYPRVRNKKAGPPQGWNIPNAELNGVTPMMIATSNLNNTEGYHTFKSQGIWGVQHLMARPL